MGVEGSIGINEMKKKKKKKVKMKIPEFQLVKKIRQTTKQNGTRAVFLLPAHP